MSSYIFQSLNTAGHTRKFRNVAGAGNIKVQEKLVLPVKKKKKKAQCMWRYLCFLPLLAEAALPFGSFTLSNLFST